MNFSYKQFKLGFLKEIVFFTEKQEFCLLKLFLVYPLLVVNIHNLDRNFREIRRMKIGIEHDPRISQLRKFAKLTKYRNPV